MENFDLTLAAVLTAPGAAAAAVTVSGVAQAIKGLAFPAAWQYGRAPMLLVASLAAALVGAAVVDAQLTMPNGALAGVLAWLAVYTGAVGTHQTITKASRVLGGTTNATGPDQEGGT